MAHTIHCEARVGWSPGKVRYQPVICRQVVGVATFVDYFGDIRAACAKPGHMAQVRRRFGTAREAAEHRATLEAVEAEMIESVALDDLPDVPLAMTEGEARAFWGNR